MYKIIALSGTNGSGKDTVGELLAEHFGFKFIAFTNDLRSECERRGLPGSRENTRIVSAEWRRQFGLAVLVDRSVEAFKKEADAYKGLVVASLRNPYEADRVHELGGTVVWVDADVHIRYNRIRAASNVRNRVDDEKTFDQFLAEEAAEMQPQAGGDAATLHTAAVKERADITLINDVSTLPELVELIRQKLPVT